MENIENNQVPQESQFIQPSQPVQPTPPIKNNNIFKYLFIASIILLLGVIIGFYFLLNNKIKQLEPTQNIEIIPTAIPTIEEPSPTPTKMEVIPTVVPTIEKVSITPTKTEVDPLKEISALLNPNNKPNFTVGISKMIGNYATGGAGFADDSGYGWIAAKVNGTWKIVTTGQDAPYCSVVNQYQVPKEIYGSCY